MTQRAPRILLLAVLALSSCGAPDDVPLRLRPGVSAETRAILNGSPATAAQLYSTVALVSPTDGSQFCTGTLVAQNAVLTAAHCVVEQDEQTDAITREFAASEIQVVAGALDSAQAASNQRFNVDRIVRHPSYPGTSAGDADGLGRYEDMAVLVLQGNVDALPVAGILPMADVDTRLVTNANILIAGYGTRAPGGQEAGVLYVAEVPFVRRSSHEFLAGRSGTPDTCPGDSGGPAYVMVDSNIFLVGVTSRAGQQSTADCGEGGVYGLAPAYADWVAGVVGGGSGSSSSSSSSGGGASSSGGGGDTGEEEEGEGEGCRCADVSGVTTAWLPVLAGVVALRRRRTMGR